MIRDYLRNLTQRNPLSLRIAKRLGTYLALTVSYGLQGMYYALTAFAILAVPLAILVYIVLALL